MRQEIRNCKSDQKNATSENVTSLELVSFFQSAIKLIVSPGVLNDVEWMIGVLRVSMTSVTTPGMGIGVIPEEGVKNFSKQGNPLLMVVIGSG